MTHTAEPMTLDKALAVVKCLREQHTITSTTCHVHLAQLDAIRNAIDAELAKQREGEPVGYRYRHSEQESWHFGPYPKSWWECQPLYTHPQQRNAVEVTDEMIERACQAADDADGLDSGSYTRLPIRAALEAAIFSVASRDRRMLSASVPVARLEALFKHWEHIVVGAGGFFRDELAKLITEYKQ